MTDATIAASLFALGLAIGSFLNVCIYRLPRAESVVSPSSHCPACGTGIRWYDNLPVVGYVILRGKCRDCGEPFSAAYPLVELGTGGLFLLHYVWYGWQPLLAVRLVFACAMVVLFMIDLRHRILPNTITLPGIVIGLALAFVLPPGWLSSVIGILLGGGLLLGIGELYYRVRGEEGLGMGDVKMLAMIGAFLGWHQTLVTLVLSSFLGSLIGLGLIATGQGTMKYALPFGSFLAIGAIVSGLAGDSLLAWYLTFY
jgi:leader peptidase (prepilin peptidase)/N-methyltransferase